MPQVSKLLVVCGMFGKRAVTLVWLGIDHLEIQPNALGNKSSPKADVRPNQVSSSRPLITLTFTGHETGPGSVKVEI